MLRREHFPMAAHVTERSFDETVQGIGKPLFQLPGQRFVAVVVDPQFVDFDQLPVDEFGVQGFLAVDSDDSYQSKRGK